MPVPFLLLAAISLAAPIISTGIQASFQSKENEKNRKEMRGLADIQRADEQKQLGITNELTSKRIGLQDKQLSFSKQMLAENMKDKTNELAVEGNKANQSFLEKTTSNLFNNDEKLKLSSRLVRGY